MDLNSGPRRHRAYRPMLGCFLEDEGSRTNVVLRCGVRGAAILNVLMTKMTMVTSWSSTDWADKYGFKGYAETISGLMDWVT